MLDIFVSRHLESLCKLKSYHVTERKKSEREKKKGGPIPVAWCREALMRFTVVRPVLAAGLQSGSQEHLAR